MVLSRVRRSGVGGFRSVECLFEIHWHCADDRLVFQCIFAIISGGTMYFLPDTPRWYYARNRFEEGDAVLAQLNDTDVTSEKVQFTRREIMAAIEAELEANASLRWTDFLTLGFVDKTKMKIVRRICMCFWRS